MRIAVTIFLTDETITPTRLARELEQRGFAGLYLPEHTHIPTERTSPYPAGGDLPREYGRTLDPFVALGQAAAVTERLGLGTGITLVAQHDAIDLAKQIATLDHLSGGRFTLGLGYGWNVEEAADHGVAWRGRRELVRDRMALMRALWNEEPTAHQGEFGSVRASFAHPKPAQKPRGPVVGPRTLVGGAAGPRLFAHICEYADGWLPIGGRGLGESLPALRAAWADAGRDPAALQVVPYAVFPTAGKLDHYAGLGIEEVVVQLPPAGESEVLRALDGYAAFLPAARGTV
ncbi:TIGR03619 family F420-dependent LLM class oxidoreductase [Streptomyces griseoviridis]|uniref:TIGR03619 family F420-dependent LLM class oxidoreductase n=1 Tax=Streptomyces hintoniae TaxID=3075521 RepID=A0ABU2UCQ3_9ACTN|nr:TIGR03619 family F420-dependent LLM class oxidoreductase [Streptomyces sp. DSM 41014]MDT0471037.1 TIGR03619 family F420-dependent LLM class oxidoreductase [Streptomyces sp. DSM 41014]